MNYKIFGLLLCFAFVTCKNEKKEEAVAISQMTLTKSWRLTEILLSDEYIETSSRLDQRKVEGQIANTYLLNLFPDSVFTKLVKNNLIIGRWSYQNNLLILSMEETNDTFNLQKIETNKGYHFLHATFKNHGHYTFVQEYNMLKDFKDDPYYPSNNLWRISAKEYETKKQLKERMINYLIHTKMLIQSSLKRENKKIRLGNSLGPIRIFDGGIGLRKKDAVPKEWLHTYFSDSQGYEVMDEMNKYFVNELIPTKDTSNWKIANIEIIDDLIQKFEN